MKQTACLVLCTLVLTSVAGQAAVRYDTVGTVWPASPKSGEPFTITVEGVWADACIPDGAEAVVDGKAIHVYVFEDASFFPPACATVLADYSVSAAGPGLPAGRTVKGSGATSS